VDDAKPLFERSIIAIVDDDDAVRESFQFALGLEGFNVRAYSNGDDFFSALPTDVPVCVIVDQQMPDTTGLEIAARLRADGLQLPIILLTGGLDSVLSSRALALGINHVLGKPPPEGDLVRLLRICLSEM
jgi:FixJ family two-component response regulator